MQMKKDEIRNAILVEARKEFIEKGFTNASLRKIVKLAGTTIGNFYNYFDNKEMLFDTLVKDDYERFIYLINNHDNVERPDYLWDTKDISQWRLILSQLIKQVLPIFSDSFVLLIESSKGTKYENTRSIFTNILKEHFIEHIEELKTTNVSPEMATIISEQVLEGFILIIKNYKEQEKRQQLLTEHILYHFLATMAILGSFK